MTKKGLSSDGVKVKQEVKDEKEKDFDPAVFARDRLKGALQDCLMHSDNSTDSEDYRMKLQSVKKVEKEKVLQKKRKHKIGVVKETPFQHAFVMKLFDRSVDLAQFEENTPLYPICRAWMANKPRSFVNSKYDKDPFKKLKKEEAREKDKKGKSEEGVISNVYTLPAPSLAENIPAMICPPSPKNDLKLPAENEKNLPSKEVLLASHLAHWGEVKKKMRTHSFRKEDRFEASKKILKRIFHGAQ